MTSRYQIHFLPEYVANANLYTRLIFSYVTLNQSRYHWKEHTPIILQYHAHRSRGCVLGISPRSLKVQEYSLCEKVFYKFINIDFYLRQIVYLYCRGTRYLL